MTKRDFFILVFKLFAIYGFVLTLFTTIPSLLSYKFMMEDPLWPVIIIGAAFAVATLYVLLMTQSRNVVSWLKLEKGFDEDRIDFQHLRAKDIIKIGAFITGAFLIIDNFPYFIRNTLDAFSSDLREEDFENTNMMAWIVNMLNVVIGYLMITNLEWIAKWLGPRKKAEDQPLN